MLRPSRHRMYQISTLGQWMQLRSFIINSGKQTISLTYSAPRHCWGNWFLYVSCEDHQRKSLELVINHSKHSTESEFLNWCQKQLWRFAVMTDEQLSAWRKGKVLAFLWFGFFNFLFHWLWQNPYRDLTKSVSWPSEEKKINFTESLNNVGSFPVVIQD